MTDNHIPPSRCITDALRSAETDPRRPTMTTEIDAVALEAARTVVGQTQCGPDACSDKRGWSNKDRACECRGEAREVIEAYLAALASAQPAQAGEYEGLGCDPMENGYDPRALEKDYRDRIRTLARERDEAREQRDFNARQIDRMFDELDAAEARVKALTEAGADVIEWADCPEDNRNPRPAFAALRAALASSDAVPESKEGE